jgi:hypothetical protein
MGDLGFTDAKGKSTMTDKFHDYDQAVREAIAAQRFGDVLGQEPGTVQREVWRVLLGKDGASLGRLILVESRLVTDVVKDLMTVLWSKVPDLVADVDRMGISFEVERECPKMRWPRRCTVACHATTGANEGHFAEVGIIVQDEGKRAEYVSIFSAKTPMGMVAAQGIVTACMVALEV